MRSCFSEASSCPARRGAGGARPEVEAVGVARCWREGGPFEDGFGGRAAARAEGGAEEGFRDASGAEGGGGAQAGGVAGWCVLRGVRLLLVWKRQVVRKLW